MKWNEFARRWAGLAAVMLSVVILGCSVNPATGERQLTLMGTQQEIAMGQEADKGIVASMGLYPDEDLQRYIQELGEQLAATSERPELPWTFRVVDDPIVNAFALPGGFIYITRGILSHFNSEAELVSVLGHEIGHVTGRHGVERLSKAQLAQIGMIGVMVASPEARQYGGLLQQGMGLLFLKFSRDDERQADDLGLRYLLRNDYDPREMPKVFETLDRVSTAAGGGRLPNWLATHPAPQNRSLRLSQAIDLLEPQQMGDTVNRESYLQRLAGLTFGEDPREGYFLEHTFYHPTLKFRLDFPAGWQKVNQRQAVGAISPNQDAMVVLTLAQESTPNAAAQAFFNQQNIERGRQWRQGFFNFRTLPQAQQQGQQQSQGDTVRGLAGFFQHDGNVYRLLSYTRQETWDSYRGSMQQSSASFRRLTERRYLDVEPKRLEVVKLRRAMTMAEFHQRYPSTIDLASLAILNGVGEQDRMAAGTLVKRVSGGELPTG